MADTSITTAKPDYSAGHVRGFVMARGCVPRPTSRETNRINFEQTSDAPKLEDCEIFFEGVKHGTGPTTHVIGAFRNMYNGSVVSGITAYYWGAWKIDMQFYNVGVRTSDASPFTQYEWPQTLSASTKNGLSQCTVQAPTRTWVSSAYATKTADSPYDELNAIVLRTYSSTHEFRHFVIRTPSLTRVWQAMRSGTNDVAVFETSTQTVIEV